ncbi:hypothetical protein D9M68_529940 [compost metagenome]
MPLHVLGHVETQQLDTHGLGQLTGGLRLADTGRTGEQEGADRLVRRFEPRARQLDRRGQRVDRRILAEHGELEVPLEIAQQLLVGAGDVLRGNPCDLRDDILHLRHIDTCRTFLQWLQTLVGARLVDHVDGLVRHVPIIDIACRQLGSRAQRLVAVLDAVMLLEARLQPTQNADGVLHRRLRDIHLLKTPRQRTVFLEDAAELLKGGRTDAADLTGRQHRLEQVGGIHHPAGRCTSANDGVDLVDEQHRMGALAQLVEQRLEAFLEVTAVLGTGQQGTEIQGIDDAIGQQVGDLSIDDALGQTFGDGGLAHPRLADQQRVVLAAPRENLRDPLDFVLAPDQRIDAPLASQFVQVAGIGIERIARGRRVAAVFVLHFLVVLGMVVMPGHLGDTVGDEIDHVDAGDVLLLEQEYRLAFLFAEDGDQYVGAGHLALAGALHVEHRALQDTLESQGRLGLAIFVVLRDQRRRGIDELLQVVPELVQIGATGPQHARGGLVVQKRQKKVLDRHELMTLGPRLLEGQVECDFELAV